jgi:hypothetical protein
VQKLCPHVFKWKISYLLELPRMEEEGAIKENDGWCEFKYDTFDIL